MVTGKTDSILGKKIMMLLLPTTPRGPLSPAGACLLLRCCTQQHLQELEGAVSILFLLKRGFLVTSVSF